MSTRHSKPEVLTDKTGVANNQPFDILSKRTHHSSSTYASVQPRCTCSYSPLYMLLYTPFVGDRASRAAAYVILMGGPIF
jgi:hypothetical protein